MTPTRDHLRGSLFVFAPDLAPIKGSIPFQLFVEQSRSVRFRMLALQAQGMVTMAFKSILFPESDEPTVTESREVPAFFRDLNLDQIVEAITSDSREYALTSFFYSPPMNVDAIEYRLEVMEDLEKISIMQAVRSFSEQMRESRSCLAKAKEFHDYRYAFERWFLCAVDLYINAVEHLTEALRSDHVQSSGLLALGKYLSSKMRSEAFQTISAEARQLRSDLSSIQYCLLMKNGAVTVSRYDEEADYNDVLEEAFKKFRRLTPNHQLIKEQGESKMNHIQSQILDRLALLHPDLFQRLDQFYSSNQSFLDPTIARFDREVQFYVAYLGYIDKLRRAGVSFCRPRLSEISKELSCHGAVDLALASRLIVEKKKVVQNDFYLVAPERILVVSGPNQGGKTTFARMFGQLHYLANLGCLVPGTDADLFQFDRIFTHFEHREDITSLHGKLQDDLVRIRRILVDATSNSVIILNEVFSSTTLRDAVFLSGKVMDRISELDALCVWVTFLDELASSNEKTVSIVSMIDPDNPGIRTFKLERRPADGLAYALALAQKYRVTYDSLMERLDR